jgi:UDP-N-acetylmuramoyl-tripeptide--D-alanyl-D-alanine ligase
MTDLFELFYECSGVCTDSRNIETNSLFIALKGANFNGNTFAEEAIQSGSRYAIVDDIKYQTNDRILLVVNTLEFLQKLANFHRKKFNIPIIGITGSNGKTSTKELVNAVLSSHYNVLCTKGNLNNHIGVPLTLLRLKISHDLAIIEMGANQLKDIAELCAIASPTHGIITNIGKAHLQGFGNFEGVLKTKCELYESISAVYGTIVINNDDHLLKDNVPKNVGIFTYGTKAATITGQITGVDPFISFKYTHGEYSSPDIRSHLVGKYNFYNFLSAVSFGILFDVPYVQIEDALANYIPENNRSQVIKTASNTLIMDCYNANPTSMLSAIESFAMIRGQEKLFIIGDMLELGKETQKEHQAIAVICETLGLKGITIGPYFKETHSEAFIHQFKEFNEAQEYLTLHPIKETTLLLKGSRGMGLERLQSLF